MTTSKIQEIKQCKPWNGPKGTILYHHLIMENGDKINIGKAKEQLVGWELNYEITGDEQHEFRKAKALQVQEGVNNFKKATGSYDTRGVEIGHAVNNAVNMVCAGVELNGIDYAGPNSKIIAYAEWILKISDELKANR